MPLILINYTLKFHILLLMKLTVIHWKQLNQSILEIQTEMSLMDQEYKKIGIEN